MRNDNYLSTSVYNAALYLRLSKEDEIAGQSESIQNQQDFLTKFVLEQGWNIVDIYIDDGYSGLNYDRPGFQRMLANIEKKKINLVITKDLSRLGRDYIDTGYYLERYFPSGNIRYIALNDGIDTMADNGNNDISPFKAVINDMYAKDISKKVRAAFNTKRQKGQFIGGFAPYGYMKDPSNKNKLLIDPDVSAVVRRIFGLYLNGGSMCGIVRLFNSEGLPCPAKYKSETTAYKNAMVKRYLWTQETVKRILTNPAYIGNMAQRRQEKINYKVDKFRKIPPKDWIIAVGTHEPIIEKADFELTQTLIQKKILHYNKPEKAVHLLNGLMFCKECGAKMTYRRNKSKKMVALCMTYSKYGITLCTAHKIREDLIEKCVFDKLREIAEKTLGENFTGQFKDLFFEKPDYSEKESIQKRSDEIKGIIKSLYTDKLKGIIDEDLFIEMSSRYSNEKNMLSDRLSQIETEMSKPVTEHDYKDIISKIIGFEIIERNILAKLINRIEISEERQIFITFNFCKPCKPHE
ncbi:MAG: recombinase family protein [Oscillospiraceae bacterium]|jgi:DNA invertase Pin-like site-specific DNA recombinase|nr:recombinase family protein [Oscillospiraceae bacterium]